MKYHLFAGPCYYPGGGIYDHQGAYPTLDDAVNALPILEVHHSTDLWAHVVDVNMQGVCRLFSRTYGQWTWVPSEIIASREELIKYDVPLAQDTPNQIIADWLEDNDRPDAATYIRNLLTLTPKKLHASIKTPQELLRDGIVMAVHPAIDSVEPM